MQTSNVGKKQSAGFPTGATKNILTSLNVYHALVNMHGTAGFFFHRFGHKRRIHLVLQSCFPSGSLKQECLVRDSYRIPMQQVYFHLGSTSFVVKGLERNVESFAMVIQILEQRIEFIDGINTERLSTRFSPSGPANRGFQRVVGIMAAGGENSEVGMSLRALVGGI